MKKLLFLLLLFNSISFSQVNDSFDEMWKTFKNNLLEKNIEGVIKKTEFPFFYYYNGNQKELNQTEFKDSFFKSLDPVVLEAIKNLEEDDSEVSYETDEYPLVNLTLEENGNGVSLIIIATTYEKAKAISLYFSNNDDKYTFTSYSIDENAAEEDEEEE